MLYVTRDNEKVVINVSTDLANDCKGNAETILPFSWSCGRPYLADALLRYIADLISKAIKKLARKYYEQGWKDAKSHKPKQTYFQDWLE